jgi:hypothetical protein
MTSLWHIQQPSGSSICGHCCVAMVLGVQVDKIIQEIGHKHGTKAKELVGVLRNHGVGCAPKRKVWTGKNGPLPERAILSVSGQSHSRYHWVLLWDNEVHDPVCRTPCHRITFVSICNPRGAHGDELRITSYLEIF